MSAKTITITDEAYNALKGIKEGNESFTDVILKVAKKDPMSRLVGILTHKEAEEMRSTIKCQNFLSIYNRWLKESVNKSGNAQKRRFLALRNQQISDDSEH